MKRLLLLAPLILIGLGDGLASAQGRGNSRLFIVVVCDGLRPDSVTLRDKPHLYGLAREGVRFDRQHSQFPTVTMVNAAALATGAPAGTTGILGDTMYLGPALALHGANLSQEPLKSLAQVVNLEDTHTLSVLDSPAGFGGYLLGLDSVAQEVERENGFLAIAGKRGPTFLFDTRSDTVVDGRDLLKLPQANYTFLSDDAAFPPTLDDVRNALPPITREGVSDRERDGAFARFVADRAIPAAKQSIESGHPALVTLWLHNPDITQHRAGLGTLPAMEALQAADEDLMTVRAAVAAAGLDNRTDMMVLADHGFATIRLRLWLAALLVSAGLKKTVDSDDVVIAPNGGNDLLYLSSTAFPTRDATRERLQKIVDFCAAQEWCRPIFSGEPVIVAPAGKRGHRYKPEPPYKGWIDGTFAQSVLGLLNQARSPDLIISFAESADADNKGLTGPNNLAFALALNGQQPMPNRSQELVRPVKGLVYSDSGKIDGFTTGMGMHGAAGVREIHNFAAAIGADFKRGLSDQNPTGNVDVAPTIAHVLGLEPNVGPGSISPSGRVITEALRGASSYAGIAHGFTMKTELQLQGVRTTTTLRLTRLGDHLYFDDSSVEREPLGSSP